MGRFGVCFGAVDDPRAANARHELVEVLFIAVAACVCGAGSCVDMAEFGLAKEALFRQVLRPEHGIPSQDAFSRLFRLLDPALFHAAFRRFMAEFGGGEAGSALQDGVVSLMAKRPGPVRPRPRHRARAPGHCLGLRPAVGAGPAAVQDGSSEIDALLDLVGMLDLQGRTVTADALHRQRRTAQALLDGRADYVLALKENQPALLADVRLLLDNPQAPPNGRVETVDGEHGRIETRRASVLSDIDYLQQEHRFPRCPPSPRSRPGAS